MDDVITNILLMSDKKQTSEDHQHFPARQNCTCALRRQQHTVYSVLSGTQNIIKVLDTFVFLNKGLAADISFISF